MYGKGKFRKLVKTRKKRKLKKKKGITRKAIGKEEKKHMVFWGITAVLPSKSD